MAEEAQAPNIQCVECGCLGQGSGSAQARTPTKLSSVSVLAWPLILLVRLYQCTLGLVMGGHCRFQPTCSHYAIEALKTHGAIRGSILTIWRVLRCQPFGCAGYDPVPPKK